MQPIEAFEEFEHNGYLVTTDLGSAYYHYEDEVVTLQGRAKKDGEQHQVEVFLIPEDSPEFNISAASTNGELVSKDLEFEAELDRVENIETEEVL